MPIVSHSCSVSERYITIIFLHSIPDSKRFGNRLFDKAVEREVVSNRIHCSTSVQIRILKANIERAFVGFFRTDSLFLAESKVVIDGCMKIL